MSQPLICNVCLDSFTDPRMLLCGHSFCLACLENLHSFTRSNRIQCPNCRLVNPIPKNNCKLFQKNLAISDGNQHAQQSKRIISRATAPKRFSSEPRFIHKPLLMEEETEHDPQSASIIKASNQEHQTPTQIQAEYYERLRAQFDLHGIRESPRAFQNLENSRVHLRTQGHANTNRAETNGSIGLQFLFYAIVFTLYKSSQTSSNNALWPIASLILYLLFCFHVALYVLIANPTASYLDIWKKIMLSTVVLVCMSLVLLHKVMYYIYILSPSNIRENAALIFRGHYRVLSELWAYLFPY